MTDVRLEWMMYTVADVLTSRLKMCLLGSNISTQNLKAKEKKPCRMSSGFTGSFDNGSESLIQLGRQETEMKIHRYSGKEESKPGTTAFKAV